MRNKLVKTKHQGHLLWKYATNGCHLVLLLPIYSLWWSLFAGCGVTFGTFALRHCWSTGWVRPTTLTGFTATGTTRFAVDPAFTFIAAEPLPETVTFCHFSCLQCCIFCTNFAATDHMPWSVSRCFGHRSFHLVVTGITLWFLLCWHNLNLLYIHRRIDSPLYWLPVPSAPKLKNARIIKTASIP